jgi:hypothetical protein
MGEMPIPHLRVVTCLNLASFQHVDMRHFGVVAFVAHPCTWEKLDGFKARLPSPQIEHSILWIVGIELPSRDLEQFIGRLSFSSGIRNFGYLEVVLTERCRVHRTDDYLT